MIACDAQRGGGLLGEALVSVVNTSVELCQAEQSGGAVLAARTRIVQGSSILRNTARQVRCTPRGTAPNPKP